MSDNVRLTGNQKKAIRALLASNTIRAAAEACGLNEKTLTRYLAQPAFRAALAQAEGDLLDTATRRLISEMGSAIETLAEIHVDHENTAADRQRAAKTIIEQMARLRELRGIEERLAALEDAMIMEEQ